MNKTDLLRGACWPSDQPVTPSVTHCHKLIARTAAGMAYEVYDTLMLRNDWYTEWKRKNPELSGSALAEEFVRLIWPTLIEEARATLASMLANPSIDDLQKQDIYDALCMDASLMRKGKRVSMVPANGENVH